MTRNKVSRTYRCPTSSRQQLSRQVQWCRPRQMQCSRQVRCRRSRADNRRAWERRTRAGKLHRGKPADSELQSQVSKDGRSQQKDWAQQQAKEREDGSALSRKTDRPNSKTWELQPACNAREKVTSTREGKLRATMDKTSERNQKPDKRDDDRGHARGDERTDGSRRDKRPRCKPSLWGWTQSREPHSGVGVVPQPQRASQTSPHSQQNTLLWTARPRSRCWRCKWGIQEDATYHKVSLERIRDRTTAKESLVKRSTK